MSTQPRGGARTKKRAEKKSKAPARQRKVPRERAPEELSPEPEELVSDADDAEPDAAPIGDAPSDDDVAVDPEVSAEPEVAPGSEGAASEAGADAAPGVLGIDDEDDEEIVDGIPRDLLDAPDESEAPIPGEDSAERPGLEKTRPSSVGEAHLKSVLESLVFVSDKPVQAKRLARVARARTKEVERLLAELAEDYRGRGIELCELAGGWQFRSAAQNAPFVREIVESKPVRLSRAQLETLAISAYRQPLTRPELEEIRGVDSGSALKVLLERGLVKILGRKDEAGRPLLYGTTPLFLEFFGMRSLEELPTLREFSELSDESRALFARKTGEEIGTIGDIAVPETAWADEGESDERDEGGSAEEDADREPAAEGAGEHAGSVGDADDADDDGDDHDADEDDAADEVEDDDGVDREDRDPGDEVIDRAELDEDELDDDERDEEDDSDDDEHDDEDEDDEDDEDEDDEDDEDDD